MYVVWLSPGGRGGFTGIISGYAEICPGFPPPQTALAITASGRGTLGRMVQNVSSVRYSAVGSEEVSYFATYHFHTGSRPTVAKCFSE